jgi:chromosome partitioning protein
MLPNLILSVANQKGGVAKSVSSVNLSSGIASLLRRKKFKNNAPKKVLLIDIDHQASSSPYFIKTAIQPENTILRLYQEEPVIVPVAPQIIYPTRFPGLSVIPSTSALSIKESIFATFTHAAKRLKSFLDNECQDYAVVIIDCPPSFNIYVLNAFYASNYIVVPITPLPESFDGVHLLFDFLKNTPILADRLDILGFIITMLKERNLVHKAYKETIQEQFPDKILGEIHESADINKASTLKNTIFEYSRNCRAASEYSAISRTIVNKFAEQLELVSEEDE